MLNYTLTIRNAKTNRVIKRKEYPGYSGHAMMDEAFWAKQHYREKGIEIITEW